MSERPRLTERTLARLRPGEWIADHEVPGLIARRQRRKAVLMFRYTLNGRTRALTLGEFLPLLDVKFDDLVERVPDAETLLARARAGVPPDELTDIVHRKGAFTTLREARAAAQQLRAEVARGNDPAAEREHHQRAMTRRPSASTISGP